MSGLVALLFALAVVHQVLFWSMWRELRQQDEEIGRLYWQQIEYLDDDERMLDLLWNRAEMETARAVRSRTQP